MKNQDGFREEVYDKTWQGKLWGRDGALALSKKHYRKLCSQGKKRRALSPISSSYYTAAGNAFAHSGEGGFWKKFLWLSRGIWCLVWANVYSDELEMRAGGIKNMSPDELDVRSRICFKSRRLQEALRCGDEALSRWGLSRDTRALLLMGKAEILDALRNQSWTRKREVEKAYDDAFKLRGLKPTTDVRLLKSYGAYFLRWRYPEQAEGILAKALDIAHEHNLGDQEIKIRPLLAEAQRKTKAGRLKN